MTSATQRVHHYYKCNFYDIVFKAKRLFLQIIYLNGSVLKLFILWVCFFITKRLPEGRVPCEGDTRQDLGHALRTGVTGSAAVGASDCVRDPSTIQLGRTLFNIFYIIFI